MNKYSACTSIIIGKKASTDGSIMIGRNEDCKASWPKHFVIHHKKSFEKENIFKSNDNNFKIKLPLTRYKYSATPEWTTKYGVFEENGFNEFGVAMSATESAYANQQVLGYDPLVEDGIGEEAMVTVVLPYVKNAREGVQRLGDIVTKYGTCESNGILFADKNEAWYMETGSGHHWVAQRIPEDSYAVIANQLSIEEIDFNDKENYMYSEDIYDFVKNNHLIVSKDGKLNFRDTFGIRDVSDTKYNNPRVWYGQKMFNPEIKQHPTDHNLPFIRKASKLLSIDDAKSFLSSHFQETEYDPVGDGDKNTKKMFRPVSLAKTQEAHILQINPNLPMEIGCLQWIAMGVASQSVFVPFYQGINDTPEAYKNGEINYSPDSAYWIFKLAGVLVDAHYKYFVSDLEALQTKLNISIKNNMLDIENKYLGKKLDNDWLTEQNKILANKILNEYKEFSYKLISKSTDFSPLNYKQNLDL
ncbi:C69 family dipeptidase [Apilactobacillus ozensis]|uniref:C69 family dipeptidase n=1 Tax=Apilactobacillus ozensis TaxID=866801 RepID=UPI00200B0C91|nr:C69 family dipeptidase [Apilactobacillus ozensis]MCK8606542.1 C69 family dipeptidase [Apilactobacillus ozensis]